MPFTISHTVVAFPLHRWIKRLPLDALMIGATGPDLEYLYNLRVHGKYWHTFEGLLIGAVPVCFVLVLLWRKAVYQAMLAMLPKLREREDVPDRLRAPIVYTIIAIIVGGFTHIVWDAFTHFDGWGVQLIPEVLLQRWPIEPSYAWMQDLSSIVGMLVIGSRSIKAYKLFVSPLPAADRRRLFTAAAVVACLSLLGGVLNALRWHDQRWGIVLGEFAIGAMALGVAVIALVSMSMLVTRWWLYQQRGHG